MAGSGTAPWRVLCLQGSAPFTSGASGGGLFDADKRLVGILMFRMRGAGAQYFSEYREAVARDPRHALAWSGLVRASMRAREVGLARQAYGRLVSLSAVLSSRIADEFPEVLQ
jgi:hypothetical protein